MVKYEDNDLFAPVSFSRLVRMQEQHVTHRRIVEQGENAPQSRIRAEYDAPTTVVPESVKWYFDNNPKVDCVAIIGTDGYGGRKDLLVERLNKQEVVEKVVHKSESSGKNYHGGRRETIETVVNQTSGSSFHGGSSRYERHGYDSGMGRRSGQSEHVEIIRSTRPVQTHSEYSIREYTPVANTTHTEKQVIENYDSGDIYARDVVDYGYGRQGGHNENTVITETTEFIRSGGNRADSMQRENMVQSESHHQSSRQMRESIPQQSTTTRIVETVESSGGQRRGSWGDRNQGLVGSSNSMQMGNMIQSESHHHSSRQMRESIPQQSTSTTERRIVETIESSGGQRRGSWDDRNQGMAGSSNHVESHRYEKRSGTSGGGHMESSQYSSGGGGPQSSHHESRSYSEGMRSGGGGGESNAFSSHSETKGSKFEKWSSGGGDLSQSSSKSYSKNGKAIEESVEEYVNDKGQLVKKTIITEKEKLRRKKKQCVIM